MDEMRRIRKALILLALLLAAGVLTLEVLNRTVLPAKVRSWAEESATRALGRKVSIGAVRLSLWRGFLLERVAISEDPRFGTDPFVEAEQVSGGVLFLPLVGRRELLIPVLHLVRPRVRLLQNPEGEWNFRTLAFQKPAAGGARSRLRVNLTKILLTEGACELRPARAAGFPAIRVERLDADLHLSLPAQIQGALKADLLTETEKGYQPAGRLSLDGRYLFQEHRLELKGDSDWQIPSLLPFLPVEAGKRVDRIAGSVSVTGEISGNPRGPLEIRCESRTKGLQWSVSHVEGSGELSVRFGTRTASLRKRDLLESLKGSLQLEGLKLVSVPRLGELRDLSGEILFDAQGARAERLTLRLSSGVPVELSGSVSNDESRSFGFRAAAAFTAEQPPPLPEKWLKGLKDLNLSDRVSLEAVGNGSLLPRFTLRPTVTARLEEISFQPPRGPRVQLRGGQLRWQPELITFTGVNGSALERPFQLEGTLANWEQPEINASFSWGELDGEAQISLTSEKVSVESFTGRVGKGSFNLFGEIARPEPEANLYGEAAFQVEDLGGIWPAARQWLKLHPAAGDLSVRWLLQGPLNRPAGWDLDLHLSSDALQIQDIPLQKTSLHLRQQEGVVTLHSAQATLAGGTLSATGSLDRSQAPARWRTRLSAEGIQLAELARALKWKTQEEMSGELQADWTGEGISGDLKSIAGPGNLRVAGAQILELPLMGRFAEFLGLSTLKTIRFHEAAGPFRVKDGRVETDSLVMRSPQATLAISGWGGFLNGGDSPIHWKILPTFALELIPEKSRAPLGRAIAKGASYFIGEVRLSGTWKNPQSKFVPKKLTQVLNEQIFNLQDLLGDLF